MRSQTATKFLVLFSLAMILPGAAGKQKIKNVIPDAARPLPLAAEQVLERGGVHDPILAGIFATVF